MPREVNIDLQPRQKKCPICGKPADPQATPFCSKRCADVDLHRWLGGTYAIPVSEADVPDFKDGEDAPS